MHQSTEIQSRLTAERAAISAALAKEKELTVSRFNALDPEDEKKLDAIEAELENAKKTIARGEERIALLENRLEQARHNERNAELDEVAAKANEARLEGEKLIRGEYAKHAEKVAAVLKRIEALDATIETCNVVLANAGRQEVPSSNHIRHTPPARFSREVTKRISVNDSRHPLHGKVEVVRSGNEWFDLKTRKNVDDVEIVVTEKKSTDGDFPAPLYEVAILPAAEAMSTPVVTPAFNIEAVQPKPIYEWRFAHYQRPFDRLGLTPAH